MLVNKIAFCEGVREIRQDEKLTIQQLSDRSGISSGQISRIERGTFPTKITTVNKLQIGLELSDEHMLELLGFKNKKYRNVPVIKSHVKNFGEALAHAPTLSFIADYTPEHCFIVKVTDEMAPSIKNNSYVLVNRDFDYINGKIYAIKLGARILVGKVYKSKGHSYGVLVTNKHSYFNVDYRGQFTVLGQVDRIIDMLNKQK